MSVQLLKQAIAAVENGQLEEAEAMLRRVLNDREIDSRYHAIALTWLAQTRKDHQFRVECYRKAAEIDPENTQIQERLKRLLHNPPRRQPPPPPADASSREPHTTGGQGENTTQAGPAPPPPPTTPEEHQRQEQQRWQHWQDQYQGYTEFTPTHGILPVRLPVEQAHPTINLSEIQRTVGITDGPNGTGTGFFITRDGLVATTRYVVGGEEEITVTLMDGRQVPGAVVRSYPEYDLAFIKTPVQLRHLLRVKMTPPEKNDPLLAVTHQSQGLRTSRRDTNHRSADYWIPTLIKSLVDAGGDPIFDPRNQTLVGMLTTNARRSNGYVYGLHIAKIYQCVNDYIREIKHQPNRTYCYHCGAASQARAFQAFFCETCGGILPFAVDITRYPQPDLATYYGENMSAPCHNCTSRAGYYDGRCLCCGADRGANHR